jgi:hypothetical protein
MTPTSPSSSDAETKPTLKSKIKANATIKQKLFLNLIYLTPKY